MPPRIPRCTPDRGRVAAPAGERSQSVDVEAGQTSDDVIANLTFNADGLVPAIAQQHDTGEVLMLAWMDAEALRRTVATRKATYWSRSRGEYWVKGETSGHHQAVVSVAVDCDGDTVLLQVDQTGPACHTGTRTCFTGREIA
ncbi:phosphoribosyl-AMP cyclohydrolase [Glycomyces sp. NEAU-S30]|uniref:Phosphoribosyl-AMP cyclohydrolase n=1 Tax=Glycomyces niveus TaxID=2820287 RepID=A0ABS3U121_9ACTN|nr:phosphoribosyl-AMP cyclohydrolase [Glycomyces sp. NEAU-S30]